jgi:hypothetical protein
MHRGLLLLVWVIFFFGIWLLKNLSLMEKSFVGDPVQWPGLIYSPLNVEGLIFALGAVAASAGLLFEEFNGDAGTAICRRKTEAGWERLKVAFAVSSSAYFNPSNDIDLLICWLDDASDNLPIPRLALSQLLTASAKGVSTQVHGDQRLESILPEGAAQDLLERGRSHESYEETVKILDEQIKKLQNG